MRRRWLYAILILLTMPGCIAWAYAADAAAPQPTPEYLMALGPMGALALGGWLLQSAAQTLSKGVSVSVDVKLSEEDRKFLRKTLASLRVDTNEK